MSRPVYGRVYELMLRGQSPDTHEYVGKVKAPTTIHQRVWGKSSSAHTSPESVARDPWKATILPGRSGYRQLEVVYATGDAMEDDARLRRAEAYWIDRLKATRNIVRPIRPAGKAIPPPRRPARSAVLPRRPAMRPRVFVLLALALAIGYLTARVALYMPWPAAPWVASPVAGVMGAWWLYGRVRREVRKILR